MDAYRKLDGPETYVPVAEATEVRANKEDLEAQIDQNEIAQKQLSTSAKVCKIACSPKGKQQRRLCCQLYGGQAACVAIHGAFAFLDIELYLGCIPTTREEPSNELAQYLALVCMFTFSLFVVALQASFAHVLVRDIQTLEIE